MPVVSIDWDGVSIRCMRVNVLAIGPCHRDERAVWAPCRASFQRYRHPLSFSPSETRVVIQSSK